MVITERWRVLIGRFKKGKAAKLYCNRWLSNENLRSAGTLCTALQALAVGQPPAHRVSSSQVNKQVTLMKCFHGNDRDDDEGEED